MQPWFHVLELASRQYGWSSLVMKNGPVGLVAEDVGEGKFSGFFSTENAIVKYAIDMAAYELKTEIDVMKKEWTQSPGGY